MKKSLWRLITLTIALSAAIIAFSGTKECAWAETESQDPAPDWRHIYQTEMGDALATDFRSFLGPLIYLTEPSKPGPTNVVQPTPPPPPPPPALPPAPAPPIPSPLVIDNVTGYGADPETGRIVVVTSSGNIREFTFGTPGVRINWATGIEGPPEFIKGPHHPPGGGGLGPGPGHGPHKPPAGTGGGQVKPPGNTGGGCTGDECSGRVGTGGG